MEKNKRFYNQIHKNSWCGDGEEHSPTWCCERCSPIKFLMPTIDNYLMNISGEEKKIFFIISCLKDCDLAEKLLTCIYLIFIRIGCGYFVDIFWGKL